MHALIPNLFLPTVNDRVYLGCTGSSISGRAERNCIHKQNVAHSLLSLPVASAFCQGLSIVGQTICSTWVASHFAAQLLHRIPFSAPSPVYPAKLYSSKTTTTWLYPKAGKEHSDHLALPLSHLLSQSLGEKQLMLVLEGVSIIFHTSFDNPVANSQSPSTELNNSFEETHTGVRIS